MASASQATTGTNVVIRVLGLYAYGFSDTVCRQPKALKGSPSTI
jgi:hypothetical protein